MSMERLGPNILRSHTSTAVNKPIPCADTPSSSGSSAGEIWDRMNKWRRIPPSEWSNEDTAAWMIHIARKHNVPLEEVNFDRFGGMGGPHLTLMSKNEFDSREASYGSLLYSEFRQAMVSATGEENSVIDDIVQRILSNNAAQEETTNQVRSSNTPSVANHENQAQNLMQLIAQQQERDNISSSQSTSMRSSTPHASPSILSMKQLISEQMSQQSTSRSVVQPPTPSTNQSKPVRKRVTHSKGNKLWEFIRDALRDPETNPAIVRWEDASEGVFRIVESEKLAKLWGEKKNNQKMTYEKLSRAMRTYYDKCILSPVPKIGLYPKKLVYKFGPLAHAWRLDGGPAPPSPATIAHYEQLQQNQSSLRARHTKHEEL